MTPRRSSSDSDEGRRRMERTLETRKKSLGRITQHEVLVILLFLLLVLLLFFQVRYWPLIGLE